MSDKIQLTERKVPTIQELYDNTELAIKHDDLAVFLNAQPPASWVKIHPYIKGHKYLPVEKVEWMLQRFFKQFKIEITGQGVAFNGVWVTVRVNYMHPVTQTWEFHDGIGAFALQTKSGSSPADLANINNGALSMAFPLAKTLALKDACEMFGSLFGSNLNRKDVIGYTPDEKLQDVKKLKEIERLTKLIESSKTVGELKNLYEHIGDNEPLIELYNKKVKEVSND